MRNNEKTFVLSLVLFVITAIVAFMLAYANSITEDKILENTIKIQNEARQSVMKEADSFTLLESMEEGTVKEIYLAKAGENEIGWCVSVAPVGYDGPVDFVCGIDKNYSITGVYIVSMSETPGLGAKAGEEKFLSQFAGKKAKDGLSVIKSGTPDDSEILAISGATKTSEAIKKGINEAIKAVGGDAK